MPLCSKQEIIDRQRQETIDQDAAGVTVRSATVTCRCGQKRSIMLAVQCLYCREWMCEPCAEAHFGKTRAEHQAEYQAEAKSAGLNAESSMFRPIKTERERWIEKAKRQIKTTAMLRRHCCLYTMMGWPKCRRRNKCSLQKKTQRDG